MLSDAEIERARRRLERLLERHGLLLLHDAKLPSATACIAGEAIRGSWWGHAKGKRIFETLTRLEDEEAVAWAKLVLGKETLVHRRLWPALVAVAESGEDWQRRGLKADAVALLRRIRSGAGRVPIDRPLAAAATVLERRLLAHATTEHTASGRHARFLEPWATWAARAGVDTRDLPPADAARAALTAPVRAWTGEDAPSGILPWAWPILA
ncbi:MAG TPA: hypothetical protein VHL56_09340 [Candidatus Limnocylindrales bacterium]|nr:hypothetical protein [Candidatus Limnocylindrales bacterium]